MSILPPAVRPSRALADLRQFWGERRRHQIVYAALAVASTSFVLFAFWQSFTVTEEWQPPEVQYVQQWPASRTDAEVRAQQAKDAPREIAEKKAAAAKAEARRLQFKRLADKLGIE